MASAGAPAALCLTILLTLAVLLGHPGRVLGLPRAGTAAVNPPSNEDLTSSLLVNQLVLLQLMQDASNAASAIAEREARREEAAAARDASLQEMRKVVESLQAAQLGLRGMVENVQETLKAVEGMPAQHAELRQEVTSNLTLLREEMEAQGRLLEEVHESTACPIGWFRYESSCYLVDDTLRNWEETIGYCRGLGGDLVKITSAEEQEFIKGKLQRNHHYWIGLNDRAVEGHFVWTDGSAPTYTEWVAGDPNNWRPDIQDCVIMYYSHDHKWADIACTDKYKHVCERPIHA